MMFQIISAYSEHVIYFDTDSVFLYLPPDIQPPKTSTVLGGLKDEIKEEYGPDAYISQFTSIGPKAYTYRYAPSHSHSQLAIAESKELEKSSRT